MKKNKIIVLLLIIISFISIIGLSSCKNLNYNEGLEKYQDKLSSEYTSNIEYKKCTYIYVREMDSTISNKMNRTYYYELEYSVSNTNYTSYFSYREELLTDITKEIYGEIYKKVEDSKLDGKIVNLF